MTPRNLGGQLDGLLAQSAHHKSGALSAILEMLRAYRSEVPQKRGTQRPGMLRETMLRGRSSFSWDRRSPSAHLRHGSGTGIHAHVSRETDCSIVSDRSRPCRALPDHESFLSGVSSLPVLWAWCRGRGRAVAKHRDDVSTPGVLVSRFGSAAVKFIPAGSGAVGRLQGLFAGMHFVVSRETC